MSEKTFKARVQHKTQTSADWQKAPNFIPKKGEIVVVQEENSKTSQLKVGDGVNKVNALEPISGGGVTIDDNSITTTNKTWSANKINTEIQDHYVIAGKKEGAILGEQATAEGCDTTAEGKRAHAEGYRTYTKGQNSHAEGEATHIEAARSHAEGYATTICGINARNAHAEGGMTIASGSSSHAEGFVTYINPTESEISGLSFDLNYEVVTIIFANNASQDKYLPYLQKVGNSDRFDDGKYFIGFNGADNREIVKVEEIGALTYKITLKYSLKEHDVINETNITKIAGIRFINQRTTAKGTGSHAEGRGTVSSGDASHSEGYETIASGEGSHAEGTIVTIETEGVSTDYHTKASGKGSHAEGRGTTASNSGAHAEGYRTTASGQNAHAEGANTTASGHNSHTEGSGTQAKAECAHAEGKGTIASAEAQHVSGRYNQENSDALFIIGNGNDNNNRSNIVEITNNALYIGEPSDNNPYIEITPQFLSVHQNDEIGAGITIGNGYIDFSSEAYITAEKIHKWEDKKGASGTFANAEIFNNYTGDSANKAIGSYSHAEGYNTQAWGNYSHAEGSSAKAYGKYSHAEGQSTTTGELDNSTGQPKNNGTGAHAEGYNTTATGNQSHAEGNGTFATGANSHAEGSATKASKNQAHAEGNATWANGHHSHAEGGRMDMSTNNLADWKPTVNGTQIVVAGSRADGIGSHAQNIQTLAYGYASHSEGYRTIAKGICSHAEGSDNQVLGNYSHVEGINNIEHGYCSHVEGYANVNKGHYSHVEGFNNYTERDCAHVEGKYNIIDEFSKENQEDEITTGKYAHIIGNGYGEYNDDGEIVDNRSNAMTISWEGEGTISGSWSSSTGADYAEYFEWQDGNLEDEDRVGYVVTLDDGEKIRLSASTDEDVLGIISGTAAIIGDTATWDWSQKYQVDEFGRLIWDMAEEFIDSKEEYEIITEEEIEIEDEEGNIIKEIQQVPHTEVRTFKKSIGFFPHRRLNPDYDPSKTYVPRSERKEWDTVGMLGKLHVRDDGTCVVGKYAKVGEHPGIVTLSTTKTNMRVMKRISNNVVLVLLK